MTEQESNSSSKSESGSTAASSIHAKLIVGIGLMGDKEDVERFTEIMVHDFNHRCQKANGKLFGDRIQLLPVEWEPDETL